MKRFHELNKVQQFEAVQYAKNTLKSLLLEGVIQSDAELSHEQVNEFAQCAAEEAWYSEREDQIIADIADGK